MKHFELITEYCPVSGLLASLDEHPELWDAHRYRKDAPDSPHSGMSDIWLRYNDVAPYLERGSLKGLGDEHVPIWYPAYDLLRPHVRPIVVDLMRKVQGEMLGGVLITRIPPGGRIEPHVDKSWHVDYFEKFYVSVKSALGADFCCEHEGVIERLNPIPGQIWLFDNHKLHWVENNSDADRITLIVCIRRMA
jgi:hypothetical protein